MSEREDSMAAFRERVARMMAKVDLETLTSRGATVTLVANAEAPAIYALECAPGNVLVIHSLSAEDRYDSIALFDETWEALRAALDSVEIDRQPVVSRVCLCGAPYGPLRTGHADFCPSPYYGYDSEEIARWHRERKIHEETLGL